MTDRIINVLEHKGRNVVTTVATVTVSEAVELMNARRIGSLVILEGERAIGIFTERDVLVRVVAGGRDPKRTLVADVMTRDLITIGLDTSVTEAMQLVTQHRCRHLPVVVDGFLYGLVSAGDLTGWVVRSQERAIQDLHDYIRAA